MLTTTQTKRQLHFSVRYTIKKASHIISKRNKINASAPTSIYGYKNMELQTKWIGRLCLITSVRRSIHVIETIHYTLIAVP